MESDSIYSDSIYLVDEQTPQVNEDDWRDERTRALNKLRDSLFNDIREMSTIILFPQYESTLPGPPNTRKLIPYEILARVRPLMDRVFSSLRGRIDLERTRVIEAIAICCFLIVLRSVASLPIDIHYNIEKMIKRGHPGNPELNMKRQRRHKLYKMEIDISHRLNPDEIRLYGIVSELNRTPLLNLNGFRQALIEFEDQCSMWANDILHNFEFLAGNLILPESEEEIDELAYSIFKETKMIIFDLLDSLDLIVNPAYIQQMVDGCILVAIKSSYPELIIPDARDQNIYASLVELQEHDENSQEFDISDLRELEIDIARRTGHRAFYQEGTFYNQDRQFYLGSRLLKH